MTRHEARVALANLMAKDALGKFLDDNYYALLTNGMMCNCRERIAHCLKPFFVSNDIEDIVVKELRDKDNFYPVLVAKVIPTQQASYVQANFNISRRTNEDN